MFPHLSYDNNNNTFTIEKRPDKQIILERRGQNMCTWMSFILIDLILQLIFISLGFGLLPLLLLINIWASYLKKKTKNYPTETRIPGPRLFFMNRDNNLIDDNLRNIVIRGDDEAPEIIINNLN